MQKLRQTVARLIAPTLQHLSAPKPTIIFNQWEEVEVEVEVEVDNDVVAEEKEQMVGKEQVTQAIEGIPFVQFKAAMQALADGTFFEANQPGMMVSDEDADANDHSQQFAEVKEVEVNNAEAPGLVEFSFPSMLIYYDAITLQNKYDQSKKDNEILFNSKFDSVSGANRTHRQNVQALFSAVADNEKQAHFPTTYAGEIPAEDNIGFANEFDAHKKTTRQALLTYAEALPAASPVWAVLKADDLVCSDDVLRNQLTSLRTKKLEDLRAVDYHRRQKAVVNLLTAVSQGKVTVPQATKHIEEILITVAELQFAIEHSGINDTLRDALRTKFFNKSLILKHENEPVATFFSQDVLSELFGIIHDSVTATVSAIPLAVLEDKLVLDAVQSVHSSSMEQIISPSHSLHPSPSPIPIPEEPKTSPDSLLPMLLRWWKNWSMGNWAADFFLDTGLSQILFTALEDGDTVLASLAAVLLLGHMGYRQWGAQQSAEEAQSLLQPSNSVPPPSSSSFSPCMRLVRSVSAVSLGALFAKLLEAVDIYPPFEIFGGRVPKGVLFPAWLFGQQLWINRSGVEKADRYFPALYLLFRVGAMWMIGATADADLDNASLSVEQIFFLILCDLLALSTGLGLKTAADLNAGHTDYLTQKEITLLKNSELKQNIQALAEQYQNRLCGSQKANWVFAFDLVSMLASGLLPLRYAHRFHTAEVSPYSLAPFYDRALAAGGDLTSMGATVAGILLAARILKAMAHRCMEKRDARQWTTATTNSAEDFAIEVQGDSSNRRHAPHNITQHLHFMIHGGYQSITSDSKNDENSTAISGLRVEKK